MANNKFIYSILFIFLYSISIYGNNQEDSLKILILKTNNTDKVDAILKLGEYYQNTDYNKSLKHAQDALFVSEKINYKLGIAVAKNNIGYSLTDLGSYNEAIDNYQESILLFKELKEENREAIAYNDLAYIYQSQGLVKKAIENYIKSLTVLEKIGDKQSEAACLNNIGLLYHDQKNYVKALEYYEKSLNTKKNLGDEKSIAVSLNNIGSLYYSMDQYYEAKEYFFKGLSKRKKINDMHGIAQSLTNIAAVHRKQKNYEISLEFLKEAEKIQIELNDQSGLTNTINSIGVIYRLQDNLSKSREYLEKSYKMSKEIGAPLLIKDASIALGNLYRDLGIHDSVYPLVIEHYKMSDSILNTENTRKLTQIGLQYEFEKKLHKKELSQVKKDLEHEIAIKEQKIISYSFAIGLGALIILTLVILKSLNDKKKANKRIMLQKLKIEENSLKLEEALESITDSVKYAKRIQQALLQEENHTTEHFPEHFILFKPKDIVSGDFYWSFEKENYFYIAAVDCTGHGVPGALMSMLGISFLNSINANPETLSPNRILDLLRDKVIEELNQTNKDWSSRDGMDISLARIDLKTYKLEWAGANNPLWLVNNQKLKEIKADRFAINYTDNPQPFTNHSFKLKKGDHLYLFSDGFADQFGGEKGKKFKNKTFKELIQDISLKPIKSQKETLEQTFTNWKGDLEQIDDVCVIGIKI